MKKISVLKNNQIVQQTIAEDAQKIIAEISNSGFWGKQERWVLHKSEQNSEIYADSDVIDEEIRYDKDYENNIIQQRWVKLKAEYTIEVSDITEQLTQQKINDEALQYLKNTDWYIIRELDSGVQCPELVKQNRANARIRIKNI